MSRTIFALAFLALAFLACKNERVTRPICDETTVEIARDTSFLSAPLVIPIRLLNEKINRSIRQDLLEDTDFDSKKPNGKRDNLKMKVSRLGAIEVRWKNNTATFHVPLIVLAERQIVPKKLLAMPKSLGLKVEFSLRLVFETTLEVGENWQMQPKTRFVSYEWLSEVKTVGGLLNVKWLVERRLHRQMPEILVNMDSAIRANVHLEKPVGRVWRNLQKPIRINQKGESVWLKINPIRFEMGKITTDGGNLLIQVRLSATTETLVGDTSNWPIRPVLPPLVKRRSLPAEAFVYMLSEIPFSDLDQLIERQLKGKTFESEGHKLTIKKAEIWACGQNLMLHLCVTGEANGDIYLQGQPIYEPDSQRIVLQNFDFEVRSQEILLSSADWLLHDAFKNQVKTALSLELADKIQKIPEAIVAGIERGRAGQKMDFVIERFSFKPQKIWVRPDDLAILILVDARARIELEEL